MNSGIQAKDLVTRYPVLYHMAADGAWPSIMAHGLLSTRSLLTLFEVAEPDRSSLLTMRRPLEVAIDHPIHGRAVIRSQRPLSEAKLEKCLTDCDTNTWYSLLNERVFFWLSPGRLMNFMSAKEYAARPHTVLYVDTKSIIERYENQVELTHMNTGATQPFAHPRGRSTFSRLQSYPYAERRRLSDYSAIVELTVLNGVPDIVSALRNAERALAIDGQHITIQSLWPNSDSTDRLRKSG
jgi:hypothetical protein